jgi:hypothetical protein
VRAPPMWRYPVGAGAKRNRGAEEVTGEAYRPQPTVSGQPGDVTSVDGDRYLRGR